MKQYIFIIISVMLLTSLVSAELRTVLDTPQVTFRNVTGSTYNHFVGVENKNNFSIDIVITPPEDLNINFDSPLTFTLQPNETKQINYSGVIIKTGSYSRQISVKYSANNETFTLASNLIFIITGNETNSTVITPPPISGDSGSGSSASGGANPTINKTNTTVITPTPNPDPNPNPVPNPAPVTTTSTTPTTSGKNPNYTYWIIGLMILAVAIIVVSILKARKKRKDIPADPIEPTMMDSQDL